MTLSRGKKTLFTITWQINKKQKEIPQYHLKYMMKTTGSYQNVTEQSFNFDNETPKQTIYKNYLKYDHYF